MADITQTAANVRPGSGAVKQQGTAGESITAGQPVYQKTSDELWYRGDANAGSEESTAGGIALTNASTGDEIIIQTDGEINLGATLVVGELYILSAAVGRISPSSDLATGMFACVLGYARTASLLVLNLIHSTVAKA